MFKDLNIQDRVKVLRFMQDQGIFSSRRAIELYDNVISKPSQDDFTNERQLFATDGPKTTYKEWVTQMQTKYPWLELNSNKAGYDYERYFNENYNDAIARLNESEARHFTDKYKLPNHPTFSNESMYSQGPRYGGEWTKDGKFMPSVINQQQYPNIYNQNRVYTEEEIYNRLRHKFDEGGPTGAVKKAMYDRMPIVGTYILPEVDITPEPERPNWFARQSMNAAIAENAPYMQAIGWEQDRGGNYHQDPTTKGAEELRKALYEIGMNAALNLVGEGVLRAGAKAVRNSKLLDRVAEALVRQGDSLSNPREWNVKGMANYILKGKKHPELAYKAGAYSGEDVISTSTRGAMEESVASAPHKNDVVDAFFGKGYQMSPSNRTDIPKKMQQYIKKNYPGKDIKVFDIGDVDMPVVNAEDVSRIYDKEFLPLQQVIMKEGRPIVDVGGYVKGTPKIVGDNVVANNWDIWKFKGKDLRKNNGYGIMGQIVGDFIDSRGTPLLHTWNNVHPIKALGGDLTNGSSVLSKRHKFDEVGHLFQKAGKLSRIRPIEEILSEQEQPVMAYDNVGVSRPVFTPVERNQIAARDAFMARHKDTETEKQVAKDLNDQVKAEKAAEFGTIGTPQSTGLQYAWRRFKNSKGSELLWPLPGVGEAMFVADVADKLYSGDYGGAAKDLTLYGAMIYAPEIADWARNNIEMYRATRPTKEGEAIADLFNFKRVEKERNALSGNNFFHGTSAKEGNDIWKAGSINPNVTQGMYASFGEVWPEHIYKPNMYIFPEKTFGFINATDYRGNIRNEIVNNVGRKKLGINAVRRYDPGENWYTERYIDADGNKFTNFDMSTLFDIHNSNQTVIPEDTFRNAISKSNYKIHKVSPGYKQSSLIEYNPNLGRRFKLSFTEDDYSRFINDFINGKTTMFSNGGQIIWDNNGQWSHPGQVTGIIGTPFGTDITMKGVADYLYGIDEYGNSSIMTPGQEYYFPGQRVVEYPITSHKAQYGQQLSTYVPQDKLDYMKTVWDYLGERNVHPYNRAAIMGNIMKESSFNPKAKNPESSAYGLFQMIDSQRNKANKWMDSQGIKDKDLGQIDWYLHLINDNIDDYMDEYNNFMYRWDKVKQQYNLYPSKQNKEYVNQYQDYYNNTYKKRVDNNEMWSVEDLNKVMSDSLSPLDERTKMFERVFEKAGKGAEYAKRVKYAQDILDYFYPDHFRIETLKQDPLNYIDNVFQYDDQGLPLRFQYGGGLIKPFSYQQIPIVRY